MSALMTSRQTALAFSGRRVAVPKSIALRSVRSYASQQEESTSAASPSAAPSAAPTPALAGASSYQAPSVQDFQLLNDTSEAINGRAAMLGFIAALVSELSTNQGIWSQIAGRYANMELVEKPLGAASLGFAAVVALITMASLAPLLLEGAKVNSKSFGPFTPNLELTLGRLAQLGFLGLVVVEAVKGSALF